MNVHHYTSRAAVAIAAAVLLVCTSTPAQAATTATAVSSALQTVSSGSWGAVPSLSTAAPYGSGPLTLSFTNNGGVGNPSFTPQYFTVGNTGTLSITGATYSGSTSAQSTVQFIVESCSATWNETAGTCPGGTVAAVLTTSFGSSTIQATPGPAPGVSGTGIRLRVRVNSNGNVSKTPVSALTLNINVDRTQVQSATTTGG